MRAALVVSAAALALVAWPISQASATVTGSQITSPSDPTFLLSEEGAAKITIAGTTTGEGTVDIDCYYGSSYSTVKDEVPVVKEAFSVEVTRKSLGTAPCVLRAVPHEDETIYEPGEADPMFKGPRIATSLFEFEGTDYFAVSDTLGGRFFFASAGGCGLEGSDLVSATTLKTSANLFHCNAAIYEEHPEETRSALQIDGANAYSPKTANGVEESLRIVSNAPHIAVKVSFEPGTGLMIINEVDPIVECAPETIFPPTKTSCTSFVSAGVQLERTWQTAENDHVALLTDTWRSTDGNAHALNALYAQEFSDAGAGGRFEFPGSATFTPTSEGHLVTLPPSGAGTILYKSDASESEGGDGTHPQGALVYDSAPSGPLAVYRGSEEPNYNAFEMPYQRTIPAGGTYTLRMAFVQGYGLAEVEKLAGEAQASYFPSVSIASPANGSTTTNSSVTVSGTAADTVGLSAFTVDGKAVSVGAGDAWSTNVSLSSGANTITATATNLSGNSKSSSVTVTYAPAKPAPKPTPATASELGTVSGSNGQATVALACHGAAGTSCKIDVSLTTVEERRRGRLIALAAVKTHSKQVTIATLTIVIPAGQEIKIALKLNRTGRALLARFGKLPAHLSAILENEGARSTVIAQNLTIKPKPKRRKH